MLRLSALACCLTIVICASALAHAQEGGGLDSSIDAAIERSVPYLEREGLAWIEKRGCVSCHQVPFMLWGLNAAQAAGYEVDEDRLSKNSAWALTWQSWQNPKNEKESDEASTAKGNVDTMYFVLLGREEYPKKDGKPDAVANLKKLILLNQQEDGSFKPGGQLPAQRRTLEETTQVSTMWAMLALSAGNADESVSAKLAKASKFLTKDVGATSTEWHVARYLLNLKRNEDEEAKLVLQELLSKQNDDGGWGWLTDEGSDAFGTGVALYALGRSEDEQLRTAIERAQHFLVDSQEEDGGWLVPGTKRTAKGKPRPTSNYWGTAWAVIGLCESLPRTR